MRLQPLIQFGNRVQAGNRLVFKQVIMGMGTVCHGEPIDPGIAGHQQVMRGVANHDGGRAGHAEFGHQLLKHLRVRF